MNNKGISSIELLVSFVIIAFVAIGMFKAVFDILDKIDYYQEETRITIVKGNIINTLQKDLNQRKLYSYVSCGTNCYDITYKDLTTRRFKVDTTKKTIQYGGIAEALPDGYDFTGSIIFNTSTISTPTDRNDSILRIFIPMSNAASGINGDINIVYQYDSRNMQNLPNQVSVNAPVLATGMTPIKWNGSAWVNTTVYDMTWYNYDSVNKMWANAKTADGSMWVWIPRYIYKISSGWHTATAGTIEVQFSKETNDNWNSAAIGNIDTGTTSNASNNKWTNHPGFTFGSTELTGIWVAKFEATASEGVANGYTADGTCPTAGDNVTSKTIKIVPNVSSWRCNALNNMWTVTRNMETNNTYGWGTSGSGIDTHLMKNSEWGAASYLSKSNYGQGANEIWINNSQTYTTGCAGSSVSAALYNGCQNSYGTANGVNASTTGNIYGIYDISGGAWEIVSAYVNNADGNIALYGSNIASADAKYKDIYTKGSTDDQATNYSLTLNFKGDAIYETSNAGVGSASWYTDLSSNPSTTKPWILRGGFCNRGVNAGAFAFASTTGYQDSALSFRPILVVGSGL